MHLYNVHTLELMAYNFLCGAIYHSHDDQISWIVDMYNMSVCLCDINVYTLPHSVGILACRGEQSNT